ncbi:UNVERIFIED_CONTAM: hypothetical protein Slati_1669100 [Sesamum latifolium]|uniref:Uncharacterized protein n=1 Tax=Sesamum latifolium TaxID=2727402 RepID=A0AAW2XE99_9LAMI
MIKYATSLARGQRTVTNVCKCAISEESYARGLLVLEQCESTQPDDNSKGLVELARSTLLFESCCFGSSSGNLPRTLSTQSIFEGVQGERFFIGNAALSYAEFLHGTRKFSTAKELYQKAIQAVSEIKDLGDPNNLGACNMTSEEVAIAAACALGQLEAHMGNFNDAEDILTAALKKMEERFGASENVFRKDIIALARGGYAEALRVQQSRKAEGERLKQWAETTWGNRWMSLGEALELSESSPKVPVIDTRICRVV